MTASENASMHQAMTSVESLTTVPLPFTFLSADDINDAVAPLESLLFFLSNEARVLTKRKTPFMYVGHRTLHRLAGYILGMIT